MINKKLTDKRIAELLDRAEVCDDSVLTDYADIAAAMRELQEWRKTESDGKPVAYKVADVLLDNMVQAKAFKADTNLEIIPLYTTPQPASDCYRMARQGITNIGIAIEETFGGLHGTHCELDILVECKSICDAIYVAYRKAMPDTTFRESEDSSTGMFREMPETSTNPLSIPNAWISCSELMPEKECDVLALWSGNVDVLHLDGLNGLWDDGDFHSRIPLEEVTHWMALPPVPQPSLSIVK